MRRILLVLLFSIPAAAQQTNPGFDVATVKANVGASQIRNIRPEPGRLVVTNMPVKMLISWAYNVWDYQISGGPGWIESMSWDIEGKTEGKPNQDRMKLMMRALLSERFGLEVHRDTKEIPIYKLTVAKGGLKLRPLKEGDCIVFDPAHPPSTKGLTASDFCGNITVGREGFEATSARMSELAVSFSEFMGRRVVDETGISGTFHVRLKFEPVEPDQGDAPPTAEAMASIFTALQEQTGLRLESGRGPVDVLIIDRVEKASGN